MDRIIDHRASLSDPAVHNDTNRPWNIISTALLKNTVRCSQYSAGSDQSTGATDTLILTISNSYSPGLSKFGVSIDHLIQTGHVHIIGHRVSTCTKGQDR